MACSSTDKDLDSKASLQSREEKLLNTYFMNLSRFSFDKSKEIVDKERELSKVHASVLWSSTLNILNTLANSEKSFFSLVFLSQNFGSRFFKKDTLKTVYNCLLTELKKIETAHLSLVPSGGNVEQLIGHLSGSLQHYIMARIKTIGLYEQMVLIGLGQNRNSSYEDLLTILNDILATCQQAFQHPIIGQLESSFSLECGIMKHLLEAQLCMQCCQYLPSLLHLYNAHCTLSTWSSFFVVRDAKKLTFVGSTAKTSSLALYDWMVKYKNALVSKFSLYFHDVLSKQGQPQEVKSFVTKLSTDFYSKIAAFQKKLDAVSFSVMYDARSVKDGSFKGPGYHHPERYYADRSEHTGYHVMFSYPSEVPECLWPKICLKCTQKATELDASLDKPIYASDENVQPSFTYYMIRIDPSITLIAVLDAKKAERDTNIIGFLSSLATELRCNKVFAALRPGSK